MQIFRKKEEPRSTGRFLPFLGLLAAMLLTPAKVDATQSADGSLGAALSRLKYREQEQDLLHLRIDLSGVKCLDEPTRRFAKPPILGEPLTIINLWSLHCAPCMEEFQRFHNIVRHVKTQRYAIDFLFIADPPEDNPDRMVDEFWASPPVTLPAVAPCRSLDRRLRDSLGFDGVPVTLFLDRDRVVRHAYIGSIDGRGIAAVIEKLLAVLPAAAATVTRRPGPLRSNRLLSR